ncbi:diguanylate cyclase [Chitinibacter sp. ZOR0017]|uniref:sensor domain-containing diguanylate cyclase n=1 Tax=Chitinibacter sp. ZOR0017 TaxID=1339254 RepID=UPI00068D4916|nr:diguanylate cyclase [Chitinibacter sp. ZOR0017]
MRIKPKPALLLLCSYMLAAWLSIRLGTIQSAYLVVIWLASGIAMMGAIQLGRQAYTVILIGHVLINFALYRQSQQQWFTLFPALLVSGGIDALQAWLGNYYYRRTRRYFGAEFWQKAAQLPRIWYQICAIPVLLTTPLLVLLWYGMGLIQAHNWSEWAMITFIQALSNFAGVLLLLPLLEDWRQQRLQPVLRQGLPLLVGLSLLVGVALFVDRHLMILSLPVMLYIAIRHQISGVHLGLLLVGLLCALGGHFGGSGFIGDTPTETFLNLQLFIFSLAFTFQFHALIQQEKAQQTANLEAEVAARTNALMQANKHLSELATTDELTQVYNRREWQRRCAEAVVRARRYKQALSIILLDIDHFKKINDQHGHLLGDLALKHLSRLCSQHLRAIDTFARWGGEEFVILLPDTELEQANLVAEKIRGLIERNPLLVDQRPPIHFTISLGVTALSVMDLTLDDLLGRADEALYVAKASGRNRVINSASVSTSYLSPGSSHHR